MLVNNAGSLGKIDIPWAKANPFDPAVFDSAHAMNVRPIVIASNAAMDALIASKVLLSIACP